MLLHVNGDARDRHFGCYRATRVRYTANISVAVGNTVDENPIYRKNLVAVGNIDNKRPLHLQHLGYC